MKVNEKVLRQCCLAAEEEWASDEFCSKNGFVRGGSTSNPFMYADRGANILGVAHTDVVKHLKPAFDILHMQGKESATDPYYAWTPAGDDRAGVYTLIYHLPRLGLKYDVLFTTGEETGSSSAKQFKSEKKYNWIFEFDRREDDVVMYDYEDGELGKDKFFDKLLGLYGFRLGAGSYSDIQSLQHLGCIGFNFGAGYFNNHTQDSYIDMAMLESQISKFVKLFRALEEVKLEYVPVVKTCYYNSKAAATYPYNYGDDREWGDGWQETEVAKTKVDTPITEGKNGTHPNTVNTHINWALWRNKPWTCKCAKNYNHKANDNRCWKCNMTKAEFILAFVESYQKEESPKANWMISSGIDYINLRNTIRDVMLWQDYLNGMEAFLSVFVSDEEPRSVRYRLSSRQIAVGRKLVSSEVKDIMQDNKNCIEFVDNVLDKGGSTLLKELVTQINVLAEDSKERYPIARMILAKSSFEEVCKITDYLEHVINPEAYGNDEWIMSVSGGQKIWDEKWAEKLNNKLGLIRVSDLDEEALPSDVKAEPKNASASSPNPASSDSTPPFLLTTGAIV